MSVRRKAHANRGPLIMQPSADCHSEHSGAAIKGNTMIDASSARGKPARNVFHGSGVLFSLVGRIGLGVGNEDVAAPEAHIRRNCQPTRNEYIPSISEAKKGKR